MPRKLINDLSSFVSAIITLAIVFLLTFISVFGILSLKEYNKETENKNQIIVYINNLDVNEKKEFSKKLLELPGVSSIRYESKELALKAAMIELGVKLPENENPLDDAFYVYLKKDVNLDDLKENLLTMNEIDVFDFRTKAIEKSISFNKNIERFTVNATIMLSILTIFMIYNINKFSIISKKKEIHESIEKGLEKKDIKKIFLLENLVSIVISFVLSIIVYIPVRSGLISNINLLVPSYTSTIPLLSEIFSLLAVLILTVLIAGFINQIFMNKYFENAIDNVEIVKDEEKGAEDEL